MTNSFWMALAVLTALALAFVFYPLFFSSRAQRQQVDRRSQNLANYRHRLDELKAEREERRIDDATFATLKEELDAVLLEDVGNDRDTVPQRKGGDRRGVVAVVLTGLVVLPILAFGLYERWGGSDALVQAEAMRALERSGPVSPEQLEGMLTQLRDHLEEEPDNPDGWALLGRTNMQLQRYAAAADAYQRLAEQLDGAPVAATAWGLVAQARYLDSDRQWNPAIEAAIEQARAVDPDEVNALGLLGIAAYEQQAYQRAADYWTRILQVAPDYPQYASIANGVASAYRAMDKPIPGEIRQLLRQSADASASLNAGTSGSADSSASGADISESAASVVVRVELSDDLTQPDGDASVFVFARAVDGPPMPLAVARLKASELPATVTLDDSMAMTPRARLSNAEEVVVGARISTTGTAKPSPGDLEGFAEPVAIGSDMGTVEVVIDRQRP
jgi:cytochrome c-type biogenesis protein CcmH